MQVKVILWHDMNYKLCVVHRGLCATL